MCVHIIYVGWAASFVNNWFVNQTSIKLWTGTVGWLHSVCSYYMQCSVSDCFVEGIARLVLLIFVQLLMCSASSLIGLPSATSQLNLQHRLLNRSHLCVVETFLYFIFSSDQQQSVFFDFFSIFLLLIISIQNCIQYLINWVKTFF